RSPLQRTLWAQLNTPSQRWRALRHLAWVLVAIGLPLHFLDRQQEAQAVTENVDLPSYGGVLAHSYLPSNWLSALGLYGWTQYEEYTDQRQLFDPAEHFTYAGTAPEDTYVVFVIGETARWDHMGLLGYERNTTPKLAAEKNLVALRGVACDTATKLSLRCMFVREGGTANNPQRSLKEQNVFAVLHSLGFSSELFAMQSEVWFYNNTEADNYAFREMIAAEKRNEGKTVDDMLLVSELQASLANHPRGKHLVILHTKGSHYSYIQRYPRTFAQYQPECNGVDDGCSKAQLVNAFDNSILYTDTVLAAVIDQLRDKKAIMMYAADHGESIDEDSHLHGTPRHMAPDEQFRVPVLLWASDAFLAQAPQQRAWQRLKTMQQSNTTVRHEAIFDSLLGCLGYESPNGGIVAKNNWCHPPKAPA
nr:kdo(2)-lipid A phosphoethanolamine 7''-transferase [Neisseriaceae bacterium]